MLVPLDGTVYLNLSLSGYLSLFVTRIKASFLSIKLVGILLMVVIGMQVIATFNAVYGVLMTPLGWIYGGIVGGLFSGDVPNSRPSQTCHSQVFIQEHPGCYGRNIRAAS
jgi:hypothetical protein